MSDEHGGTLDDPLALTDTGPVHVTTTASLHRLDAWAAEVHDERVQAALEAGKPAPEPHHPLDMRRFRPNLVVDGDLEPFAEDGWGRLRVGEVELRFADQCGRCVLTTIDPDTQVTGKEPLRTLARHRRRDGEVWFGIQMVPVRGGRVRSATASRRRPGSVPRRDITLSGRRRAAARAALPAVDRGVLGRGRARRRRPGPARAPRAARGRPVARPSSTRPSPWAPTSLVTHHPLLLRPVHSVAATTFKGALVHRLVRAGAALYVGAHERRRGGRRRGDALARGASGSSDLEPLVAAAGRAARQARRVRPRARTRRRLVDALAAAGAGRIGEYTRARGPRPATGTFMPVGRGAPGDRLRRAVVERGGGAAGRDGRAAPAAVRGRRGDAGGPPVRGAGVRRARARRPGPVHRDRAGRAAGRAV